MLTKIVSWTAVAALFVALFWQAAGYQLSLQILICVAAVLVVLQSLEFGRAWMALSFIVVAIVFNPVITPGFPRMLFLAVDAGCLMLFLFSLYVSRHPRMSIASITDRTPGSQSL